MRNKLTFFSPENVDKSLGRAISSSRQSALVLEDFENKKLELQSAQDDMVLSIQEIMSNLKTVAAMTECPVDEEFIRKLTSDMEQQTLFEMCIVEELCNGNEGNMDQDSLVTMLAAFSYPPYVKIISVEEFIDISI
jgi:hypothetical protein